MFLVTRQHHLFISIQLNPIPSNSIQFNPIRKHVYEHIYDEPDKPMRAVCHNGSSAPRGAHRVVGLFGIMVANMFVIVFVDMFVNMFVIEKIVRLFIIG